MKAVLASFLFLVAIGTTDAQDWKDWIKDFGHDVYEFPSWIKEQMAACRCEMAGSQVRCLERVGQGWMTVDTHSPDTPLTFCSSKQWLLDHMPEFDKHYLPPSVAVTGASMFDDNIAFALMASKAVSWSGSLDPRLQRAYLLPYAAYHEARTNWRPLLFAKFFNLVASASSTREAMTILIARKTSLLQEVPENEFSDWTNNTWADFPKPGRTEVYSTRWFSSTNPPVVGPLEFVAYGYGSCTAFATTLTYIARAVGIPARQVGTPCWNSVEFTGLASDNPNVTKCWHGGVEGSHGGKWLNNHNWVEYWDNEENKWVVVNVPPGDSALCATLTDKHGCDYSNVTGCSKITGGPGGGMQDHELIAATWSLPGEDESFNGGPVVDGATWRLSSGEQVSPLVWAPNLVSPLGIPLKSQGLRFVNRTEYYRCKE